MNRSKSLADKKNDYDKIPIKQQKQHKPANGLKKKKMKFDNFLPFEPENNLHEDIEKEKAFIQKALEQKQRENQKFSEE